RATLGTAYRTWPRQFGGAISRAQHPGAALVPTDTGGVVLVVLKGLHDGLIPAQTSGLGPLDGFEHTLVILGHDLDEFRYQLVPHRQNAPAESTMSIAGMALDHIPDLGHFLGSREGLEGYRVWITPAAEVTCLVQHVSNATGHPRGKVATRLTEHHD